MIRITEKINYFMIQTEKFIFMASSSSIQMFLLLQTNLLLISSPLLVSLDSNFMLNRDITSTGTVMCSMCRSKGGSALIVHLSNNKASSGTVVSEKRKNHNQESFSEVLKNRKFRGGFD